jgi:hypothetical protein
MSKLHEKLAVMNDLNGQAAKAQADLISTLANRKDHFREKLTTFRSNEEGVAPVVEETSPLQTTVGNELNWVSKFLAKAMNVSSEIHWGNTLAAADVVLEDGTDLLISVPATELLELEKRLNDVSTLFSQIPTLDPAKGFALDPDRGGEIFKARDVVKNRTKKIAKPIVLYEATPEHPAQVQLAAEDIVVGEISTQEWSGLLTPAQKSELLSRLEEVKRAVKTARSKANAQDVTAKSDNGNKIFKYLLS